MKEHRAVYHVLYYTKQQEFSFDPSPHSIAVNGGTSLSEIMDKVDGGRVIAILEDAGWDVRV